MAYLLESFHSRQEPIISNGPTTAGLATQFKEQQDKDPDFAANWAIVSEWSPDARYEANDTTSAQTIIGAINDPKSGVLQWIKTYW